MTSDDEKHVPSDISDDELDSDVDDENHNLISSLDSSSTPSDDSPPSDSEEDARFTEPASSPMKRLALVMFLGFLFWLGFQIRGSLLEGNRKSKVVHASRYSKDYKFRPAASPVITETLEDGRTRLRGALPPPTELPKPVRKKKAAMGKVSGKKKVRKSKSSSEKRM